MLLDLEDFDEGMIEGFSESLISCLLKKIMEESDGGSTLTIDVVHRVLAQASKQADHQLFNMEVFTVFFRDGGHTLLVGDIGSSKREVMSGLGYTDVTIEDEVSLFVSGDQRLDWYFDTIHNRWMTVKPPSLLSVWREKSPKLDWFVNSYQLGEFSRGWHGLLHDAIGEMIVTDTIPVVVHKKGLSEAMVTNKNGEDQKHRSVDYFILCYSPKEDDPDWDQGVWLFDLQSALDEIGWILGGEKQKIATEGTGT